MLDNGQMEVTISFDVTAHGHSMSESRNYDLSRIKSVLNSRSVIEFIKNGYAKGFYGHGKRNKGAGYVPSEVDTNGVEVEPVCVTKSVTIQGKIITHKQRIFNTDNGIKLQKLILNGGVGFSVVWNLAKGYLLGFDAVVSPNFSGNRIIVDSICSGGSCNIDDALNSEIDSVYGKDAEEEIRDIAMDLLMHQEDVLNYIDADSFIRELKDDKLRQENINFSLKEDIDGFRKEISLLESSLKNEEVKHNSEIEELKLQLAGFGIKFDGVALSLCPDKGLSKLFSPIANDSSASIDVDSIKMLELNERFTKKSNHIDLARFVIPSSFRV